jgi:hypothetical protein
MDTDIDIDMDMDIDMVTDMDTGNGHRHLNISRPRRHFFKDSNVGYSGAPAFLTYSPCLTGQVG